MNVFYTRHFISERKKAINRPFIWVIVLILISFSQGNAQILFTETIDVNITASGTQSIANTMFDNASLGYSGTADTRTSTASSGYTGASGGRNIFFTNNGTASFQIANINTTGYTNLALSFGAHKSTNASDLTELVVEYSTDGISYSPITFTAQPTGSGTAIWRLISITSLPIAMEGISNLRIRWRNSSTTPQFRVDDIQLSGTIVTASPCSLEVASVIEGDCIPTYNDTFPNGLFYYDVTVNYSGGIPTTGNLALSGAVGASVPVGSLSGGTHTFSGIRAGAGITSFNVTALFTDNSGCSAVAVVEPPEACGFTEGDCEELFFSEYLDGGTGNNKCLEIYNPTANTIDLAAGEYKVLIYSNGASTPGSTINLSGIIPPFGTFLLCNSNAAIELTGISNQTSGSLGYNGDDAIALAQGAGNVLLDIFGNIGNDPGTAWTDGSLTTADVLLRRKSSVTGGVDTNPGGTGPGAFTTLAAEWDAFSDVDYSDFGSHSSVCTPPIPECPIEYVIVYPELYNEACGEGTVPGVSCFTCNDNGTPDPSDDYFEYWVEVAYNDVPDDGYLIISAGGVDIDSLEVSELELPEGEGYVEFGPFSLPANGLNFTISARFDEVILCSDSEENLAPGPCSEIPPCTELYFSEYIEGSGNNKCLEIFNPTDATVDLAAGNYQILMYFNGGAGPGLTISLSGIIPAKGTYVVCNSSADISFRNLADQIAGGGWYNGDDAIALSKDGVNIDIIGQIGTDPGTAWTGGGASTADQTLIRIPYILSGDPNGTDAFDPSDEWISNPQNDLSDLRFHRSECNEFSDGLVITPIGGCEGDVVETEGGYDISSSCWGNMIGRKATFLTTDICGDFDFSARVTVTPFGFAGLMFRESLALDTRWVYHFVRGNNIASWAVRSNPALPVQVQNVPQINRQYLRMQRVGNLFRGYLSLNGIVWNQVFQSGINIDACGYVGFASHSGSEGVLINSSYTNINTSFQTTPGRPELSQTDVLDIQSLPEFKVYPNPANTFLDIELEGDEWAEREIRILDINGRTAFYQKSETSNVFKIDLQSAGLTDGVYIIQIKDAHGFQQSRFVKATN